MKSISRIASFTLLSLFLLSITSCVAFVPVERHDNGRHLGWYKHSNPHNQMSKKETRYDHKGKNRPNSNGKNKR